MTLATLGQIFMPAIAEAGTALLSRGIEAGEKWLSEKIFG